LDIETGTAPLNDPVTGGTPDPDYVTLRWSDDRGRSWSREPRLEPLGLSGEFRLWPQWPQLGLARDRIYEFYWTSLGNAAMNGAYLDVTATKDG
jgi:hypothetical protein